MEKYPFQEKLIQGLSVQVISTELNRAVVELLQQLLFWQERAKSASPYNLAKRKRLVSGLRSVPFSISKSDMLISLLFSMACKSRPVCHTSRSATLSDSHALDLCQETCILQHVLRMKYFGRHASLTLGSSLP